MHTCASRSGFKEITSVSLLIPKEWKEEENIVGFHLYIPMGYIELVPFFCAATETAKYIVNNTMDSRNEAHEHPLDQLLDTPPADGTRGASQTTPQE